MNSLHFSLSGLDFGNVKKSETGRVRQGERERESQNVEEFKDWQTCCSSIIVAYMNESHMYFLFLFHIFLQCTDWASGIHKGFIFSLLLSSASSYTSCPVWSGLIWSLLLLPSLFLCLLLSPLTEMWGARPWGLALEQALALWGSVCFARCFLTLQHFTALPGRSHLCVYACVRAFGKTKS